MKQIILNRQEVETILLKDVPMSKPIFAKRDGKLRGMIVNEIHADGDKWILRIGGQFGHNGYYSTREKLIQSVINDGYTLHVEDK